MGLPTSAAALLHIRASHLSQSALRNCSKYAPDLTVSVHNPLWMG